MKLKGILKKQCEDKKRKKLLVGAIIILSLIVIGVIFAIVFFMQKSKEPDMWHQGMGGNSFSGETVSATGTTAIGILEETLELNELENELVIEEIYVSSGTEIAEGTPILKFTDDSIVAVRDELESMVKETELASRAGAIEYEQSKITAKYDYDIAVLEGTYAEAVYNEKLVSLNRQVTAAKEALAEAQALIAEYTDALTNNTYYIEYNVEELKTRYDNNRALLTEKVEEWGVEWSEITGGGSGASASAQAGGANSAGGPGGSGGQNSEHSQQVDVLSQFYSVLESNEKEYLDALEKYETAMETANTQLQIQQLSLSTLQADLVQAKSDYDEQSIEAQTEYQTTLLKSQQAQSDYDTALTKAEETYNSLVNDEEEAKEQLDIFESMVGDGVFYATNSGTIVMSRYRAGDELQLSDTIIAYSNPEEISISVSVDQTDIAKLSVGDEAIVNISGYDTYKGVIAKINPVSTSESRASVSYSVTVVLEGDVSVLSSNLTAQVVFQIGEKEE